MARGVPNPVPGEKYTRNPKYELVKEDTSGNRYFRCQFADCPRPKSLMKIHSSESYKRPIYHQDCKESLRAIREACTLNDPDSKNPTQAEHGTKSLEQFRAEGNTYEICGAKRAKGGVCLLSAGWGTNHTGFGRCKFHFGNTPSHTIANAKEILFRQMPTLGNPREIDPHSAILEEVHRTAGHVEWLRVVIGTVGMNPDDPAAEQITDETGFDPQGHMAALRQFTEAGIQPSVWIDLYQRERAHLIRTCKMAVDMGCAERTVRLAEDQGRMIASVIRKVLNDPQLQLNNAQKAALPAIVRRELLSIESTAQEVQAK